MERINVEGTRAVIEEAGARRVVHTSSCATCGPVAGRAGHRGRRARGAGSCESPTSARRSPASGSRSTPRRAARTWSSSTRRRRSGPGDLRPTPTGKMVADVAGGRARAYLAGSALNIVAVEDVARGHLLAHERGVAGRRYLLGGENLDDARGLRDDRARRRPAAAAPRGAVERRLRGRLGRRAPARRALAAGPRRGPRRALPMRFDDARARARAGLHLRRRRADALARRGV